MNVIGMQHHRNIESFKTITAGIIAIIATTEPGSGIDTAIAAPTVSISASALRAGRCCARQYCDAVFSPQLRKANRASQMKTGAVIPRRFWSSNEINDDQSILNVIGFAWRIAGWAVNSASTSSSTLPST